MQRSYEALICVGKNRYISLISVANPKYFVAFAFTHSISHKKSDTTQKFPLLSVNI